MPLLDVIFIKQAGGLGTPVPGEDHISGISFYNSMIPTGFVAAWVTATVYVIGDIVQETDLVYIALTNHTSATFATDLTANEWILDPNPANIVKRFRSIDEIEAIGIVEGVANFDIEHYHLSEFFRMASQGILWVGFFKIPGGAPTFTEIKDMQTVAAGKIRQFGVYPGDITFSTTEVTVLHSILLELEVDHKPASALYTADFSATTVSALGDLKALNAHKVTVVAGQDGGARGKALFDTATYTISHIGASLGTISDAAVSESIHHVARFNMILEPDGAAGLELDKIAFGTGELLDLVSDSSIETADDNHYLFLRKHVGLDGSFHNDSLTSTTANSDFRFIPRNRVIDKATREVRTNILPLLGSALLLNSDGTLREDTRQTFKIAAQTALDVIVASNDLSAAVAEVDPTQDVLENNTLEISIKLVPVSSADNIVITIGFVASI